MKNIDGFPANMQFTPIPNPFLNVLMPDMDKYELKCMLCFFQMIYAKKGYPRYVSLNELMVNTQLIASMHDSKKSVSETVADSLTSAIERGAIIRLEITQGDCNEYIYFLNTKNDRQVIESIRHGKLRLPQTEPVSPVFIPAKQHNIFSVYEENIGLLTPMIAEELRDALTQYSEEWIHNAIREAVYSNKRNWRYISRILECWISEGRKDGAYKQNTTQEDPDKYFRGIYGHLIQR